MKFWEKIKNNEQLIKDILLTSILEIILGYLLIIKFL